MNNSDGRNKLYSDDSIAMQRALDMLGIHTFRYYSKERYIILSDFFAKKYNCKARYDSLEEFINIVLKTDADKEKIEKFREVIRQSKEDGSPSEVKVEFNGSTVRLAASVCERDEDGNLVSVVGVIENIADDIIQSQLLEALSMDYTCAYYVDYKKNVITPFRLTEVIDRLYGDFFRSGPTYEAAMKSYIENTVMEDDREEMIYESSYDNLCCQLQNKNVYMHDFRVERDGEVRFFRMKVAKIGGTESLDYAVVGFSDISKEKQKELERYAYVDEITGGDNYIRFKQKLSASSKKGHLVCMDIHAFKLVNSIRGIKRGDETLKAIWLCIKKVLQSDDIAGHINADHFIIFFATEDQQEIADRLGVLTVMLENLSIDMKLPQLIPYFGISTWEPEEKIEMVVGEATTAKHAVKDRKDVNHSFYSVADSERFIKEKQMEDAFDEAIKNNRFEVWYQPKYSPETEKLAGAEALVRWRGVDGNLISPGVFIPLFERNGMIRILDEYVFKSVCEQQKEWINKGLKTVPVSVNLSRASLYFTNVVEEYVNITKEIGIDPNNVPIEITESATVDNEDIRNLAKQFYEAGFPLHMDDFGTGYSSLASLNVLHFDTLKIDKSLIDFIGNMSGDLLLKHTIELAKELGMHVTAEGVEKAEQVTFLQNLKCDSIQGFYYSRPLPLKDFESLIEEYNK